MMACIVRCFLGGGGGGGKKHWENMFLYYSSIVQSTDLYMYMYIMYVTRGKNDFTIVEM